MAYSDSIHKLKTYFEAIERDEVVLSANFFRDYTCPANCGGCCPKFTLDYFEGERWDEFKKQYPDQIHKFEKRSVDGVEMYTNFQRDNETKKCEYLDMTSGRCKIHKSNPFSCEFELNKFIIKKDKSYLINKLFGRGWNMMRIDGERGALCEMKGFNLSKFKRDVELLTELDHIADLFKRETSILKQIIKYLNTLSSPIKNSVKFNKNNESNQIKLL